MIGVTMSADAAAVAALQAQLQRVPELTRRSAQETVAWAGILVAQSAAKATPVAKKLRPVETQIINYTTKRGKPASRKARGVMVYRQNRPPEFAPLTGLSGEDRTSVRKIRNRQLAKSSWFWMLSKMNKGGGGGARRAAGGIARNYVGARKREWSGNNPALVLENRLGWIRAAAPGIEATAMRNAAAGIAGQIERRIESRLRRLAGK